jgi:plastocyanin
MYKDSIGQEIKIGDKIAFIPPGYRNHEVAIIKDFSKAGVPIIDKLHNRHWSRTNIRTTHVKVFTQN